MSDDLNVLSRYLRGDKEVPLGYALAAYHRLLSEATSRYHEQSPKPSNKNWIGESVVYNWPPEKYAARLEDLFSTNDPTSTHFPWWAVLQILFQLFRLLLKRA